MLKFWCDFDDKKYDFDRVVLFMDFVLCESIDVTGVLLDWWVVNRCVLMCYFFIIYSVFCVLRWNALFTRVWGYFLVLEWWFLMMWKVVKCLILVGFVEVGIEVVFWVDFWLNTSGTLILQGICGLNRYAVHGNRQAAL